MCINAAFVGEQQKGERRGPDSVSYTFANSRTTRCRMPEPMLTRIQDSEPGPQKQGTKSLKHRHTGGFKSLEQNCLDTRAAERRAP